KIRVISWADELAVLAVQWHEQANPPRILVLSMVSLATCEHRQNFGKQGFRVEIFLAKRTRRAKKYYPSLAWRKAFWIKMRVFFYKKCYKPNNIKGFSVFGHLTIV